MTAVAGDAADGGVNDNAGSIENGEAEGREYSRIFLSSPTPTSIMRIRRIAVEA
jgi:hypothetical protein